MSSFRVLHIDDEPDIRKTGAASLSLDPEFAARGGCDSGAGGLVAAAEWRPDLILLDIMMPVTSEKGIRSSLEGRREVKRTSYSGH